MRERERERERGGGGGLDCFTVVPNQGLTCVMNFDTMPELPHKKWTTNHSNLFFYLPLTG